MSELTPVTRKEQFYDRILQAAESGGGGGGGSTLIEKSISANGVYNASDDSADGYSKVTVDVPSGGGGSATRKDVNFYDYDGTIFNSYTAAEFAELTAMPDNPSHEGLTAQGWNWSLSDAKSYVTTNGKLDIGQMYVTSDGKTRLYINLLDDYKSPTLELYLNANSEVDVDWGDGSSHSTLSSTSAGYQSEMHTYAASGDYIVAITVVNGSIEIYGNNSSFSLLKGNDSTTNTNYRESLFNIEIGSSVTSIGNHAVQYCSSLASITIPLTVTSIGSSAFSSCYSLTSVTIPSSVTSISDNAFYNCSSLASIIIPSGVTSIGAYAFSGCTSLTTVTIPLTVTSIGSSAFSSCYSLTSVTIPLTVTSISDTFSYCYSLLYINYLGTDLPTGSPWGAPNSHVKVRALRYNNYTSAVNETSAANSLTTDISCNVGDLIVATFETTTGEFTLSSGWTLLGDSGHVTAGGYTQISGMAYKIATSSNESITISTLTTKRIFTNLIAITGASIGAFSGFTKNETNNTITATKPQGLTIWAVSTMWWGSKWDVSPIDDKAKISNLRCANFLDQSDDTTVTFTTDTTQPAGGLACASLTITGIDNFWYYDD